MVFHGIPILVCENINPPPAAALHLLYTVYPPTTPRVGVAQVEGKLDRYKGGEKSTTALKPPRQLKPIRVCITPPSVRSAKASHSATAGISRCVRSMGRRQRVRVQVKLRAGVDSKECTGIRGEGNRRTPEKEGAPIKGERTWFEVHDRRGRCIRVHVRAHVHQAR